MEKQSQSENVEHTSLFKKEQKLKQINEESQAPNNHNSKICPYLINRGQAGKL